MTKPKKQGGTRPGAGAPKKEDKKTTYSTKLRPDQIVYLRSQENAAGWLEEIIDDGMERATPGQSIADAKATAIPAVWETPREVSWVCSCGTKNEKLTAGATAACSECRTRVFTGNTGAVVSLDMLARIRALLTEGVVYYQTSFGAGAWVDALLSTAPGGICPWATDKPVNSTQIAPFTRIAD